MELVVARTDIIFGCASVFKQISTHQPKKYRQKHIEMKLNRLSLNFIVDALSVISYTFDCCNRSWGTLFGKVI